jgi:heat shock protein HslJ
MLRLRIGRALALGIVICAGCAGSLQAQEEFPFGRVLLLDAAPMKGGKRIPALEIETSGSARIELWCNTIQGRVLVDGDKITISAGDKTERTCAPERMQADDELAQALTQVTGWRWSGEDLVVLTGGAKDLRFQPHTN